LPEKVLFFEKVKETLMKPLKRNAPPYNRNELAVSINELPMVNPCAIGGNNTRIRIPGFYSTRRRTVEWHLGLPWQKIIIHLTGPGEDE
jgi:hypothetical protein